MVPGAIFLFRLLVTLPRTECSSKWEHMMITCIVPQLRRTDMASSVRFYTEKLGFRHP
jgi:hypothetical protein